MTDTTTSTAPASESQEEPPLRAFQELRESGLLWLINHRVLHPRGVALALYVDEDGQATGWNLLASPDGKPWTFNQETNDHGRARAEATLTAAGALPASQRPELPPYTGDTASCEKCGHDLISTEYRRPHSGHVMIEINGALVRGPLPERHLRECDRCRYQWHEAVGAEPELPERPSARELAYALDNTGIDS
ncbi:hypothetical protein [Streptomyces sp. OE57]|uniref:hypothetical protein n=1 Tax=Streptomyces lacaronensis TaxID=3379885 RepID=UPI0039B72AC6